MKDGSSDKHCHYIKGARFGVSTNYSALRDTVKEQSNLLITVLNSFTAYLGFEVGFSL